MTGAAVCLAFRGGELATKGHVGEGNPKKWCLSYALSEVLNPLLLLAADPTLPDLRNDIVCSEVSYCPHYRASDL